MKKLLSLFFILYSLFTVAPAYAANPCPAPSGGGTGFQIGPCFGFGGITSLGDAVSRLVTPAFSVAAAAVIIYFLMGALKFLMSGGNKEEVAAGRNMITHAIIGFIILIFAFLILQFLLSSLFGITGFRLF